MIYFFYNHEVGIDPAYIELVTWKAGYVQFGMTSGETVLLTVQECKSASAMNDMKKNDPDGYHRRVAKFHAEVAGVLSLHINADTVQMVADMAIEKIGEATAPDFWFDD